MNNNIFSSEYYVSVYDLLCSSFSFVMATQIAIENKSIPHNSIEKVSKMCHYTVNAINFFYSFLDGNLKKDFIVFVNTTIKSFQNDKIKRFLSPEIVVDLEILSISKNGHE